MQRIKRFSVAPAAMDDDGISVSQTPGGAGALTITGALASGGVATLDIPRRVMISCAGNNSGRTFTITGTSDGEKVISETITGPNATTVSSLKDYKTVTGVSINGASTGAVKIGTTDGTTGTASTPCMSTPWCPIDRYDYNGVALGIEVTGTINYTVQHTLTDPNTGPLDNPDKYLTPYAHPTIAAKTANDFATYSHPLSAVRVTVNSYTPTTGAVVVNIVEGSTD